MLTPDDLAGASKLGREAASAAHPYRADYYFRWMIVNDPSNAWGWVELGIADLKPPTATASWAPRTLQEKPRGTHWLQASSTVKIPRIDPGAGRTERLPVSRMHEFRAQRDCTIRQTTRHQLLAGDVRGTGSPYAIGARFPPETNDHSPLGMVSQLARRDATSSLLASLALAWSE